MKVFVIGATGLIGSHVARRLVETGHEVTGLARSVEAEARLEKERIAPIAGDAFDKPALTRGMLDCDAVVFAPQLGEAEGAVVAGMLEALEGSGKTFIFCSGTGVLAQRTGGEWSEDTFAEDDPFEGLRSLQGRRDVEKIVRAAGRHGIRGIVMRPPAVWADSRIHGLVLSVVESVKRTGAACYIGLGLNLYSSVHAEDLADAFRLALESGESGAVYHAVSGEAPNRWIAEMVARVMGCETRSITVDEAIELWGKFSTLVVMATCSRSRSPRMRALGWRPTRLDMMGHAEAALRQRLAVSPVGS